MTTFLRTILLGLAVALGASSAQAQNCSGQAVSAAVCGNPNASTGLPSWATQTALLDRAFGTTSGTVLNRGSSVWAETSGPTLGANGGTGGSIILNGATSGSVTIGAKAAAGTATIFNLPITNGSLNNVLITDGSGNTSWTTAGAGTVSSVGLSMPGIFTVSGSPVVGAGTLTATLATETANTVWAGPTTGAASAPTFRALVGADLPNPSASTLGGIQSFVAVGSQWIRQISTSGVPTASQPAFTDISGVATGAQLPNPSASTLGGIESLAAVASKWINTISTSGVPSATQPVFSDISGQATLAQLPSIGNNRVMSNISGGTATPLDNSLTAIIDSAIGSTQGQVLYRSGTVWTALSPGTSGQVLTTAGAAANPSWATVTGTGTVTNVATGSGLTGGPITTTGTIALASISTGNVLGNVTGGSAAPSATTPTQVLDVIGSTQGQILYRGAGVWTALAPGTNGQFLQTQGAGSTPQWASSSVNGVVGTVTIGIQPQGRLTLTTATPITTTDVTGATTHFYTPYIGTQIPIYDGSTYMVPTTFAELSQATSDTTKSPAAVVNNSIYDIFVWNDSGTIRATRGPPWTSDTARGTGAGTSEIQQILGIWTNKVAITNGPAANRGTLVGSIRSNGSAQLTDSAAFRWVSNIYSAVPRNMKVVDTTDTWNYTTAAFRQADGNAANQLDILQSLSGGMMDVKVTHHAANTNSGVFVSTSIGIDQCTTPNADNWMSVNTNVATLNTALSATYDGYPGLGRHFACWEERSNATGTTTWYGDLGVTFVQSGISGWINN